MFAQLKSDFFELSVCVLCFYRVIHQQDESKSETAKWYKIPRLEPEIDTMLNIRYQTVNGSQKQQMNLFV